MDKRYRFKSMFSEFFKKNKNAVYLLPILGVVLIVAVILLVNGEIKIPVTNIGLQNQINDNAVDKDVDITANSIDILPKIERKEEDDKYNSSSSANPFELPMKVSGIVIGSYEQSIAIIETSQTSHIVKVGDFIDNLWEVKKIEENGVLLLNGQKEIYISFED